VFTRGKLPAYHFWYPGMPDPLHSNWQPMGIGRGEQIKKSEKSGYNILNINRIL
jgi:hypothetical protein